MKGRARHKGSDRQGNGRRRQEHHSRGTWSKRLSDEPSDKSSSDNHAAPHCSLGVVEWITQKARKQLQADSDDEHEHEPMTWIWPCAWAS
jgi:hypothetical protein